VLLLSIIVLRLAPAGAGSYTSGGATLGANSGSYGEVVSTADNLASTISAGSTGPIDLNIYKKAVRSDGVFAEADLQVDQGIVNSYVFSWPVLWLAFGDNPTLSVPMLPEPS